MSFRIRLRVRLAKSLHSEAQKLSVNLAGKDVSITSHVRQEPLDQAKWVVFGARAFETEEAAFDFGRRLRAIVELVCLSLRIGVDVGNDKPTSWVREEFARARGFIKPEERIVPNVHGLMVLPDDDLTRFPVMEVEGNVLAPPGDLVASMEELGGFDNPDLGRAQAGVRLLNQALMTSEPLAQMVLAFSAIEELGQNETWDDAQLALIRQLAATARHSDLSEKQRTEVARAIETGLFKLSLRQGVIRLLQRFGVSHLQKEWDRLYSIRSGIFHGTARLAHTELHQPAQDTITLCTKIVFAIVLESGGHLPTAINTSVARCADKELR